MFILTMVISSVLSATSVSITEPVDGETYDGDWLTVRAIVENENVLPDSVHYSLNGNPVTCIPRLNTDWPTYMQNFQNHGYSESPAPHDNTILWAAPVTGEFHEFPTPVTYDGMIFYTTDSICTATTDTLFALDAATGSVIWTYDTGHADDAVTVIDGRLYTAADSIFCFDAYSGEKMWSSASGNWAGSTPIVIDDKVFCADYVGTPTVVCLNGADGSIIWSVSLTKGMASCMGYWNRILVVPTTWASIDEVIGSLYGLNAETGEILWENTDTNIGYWDSSPTIVDGIIYINDYHEWTFAIDALTGETLWEQSTGGGTATIAYHDGRLYFSCERAPYYCLDASSGNIQWFSPYAQHGSSGVADGLVFFGEAPWPEPDSARVIALNCETGAEVWSYETASSPLGFQGSPSVTDGVMYYPCTDGFLYAFGTGLKYTYREDFFYAEVGANDLIVTSYDDGAVVAADTISFTVTQTGINLEPSRVFKLSANPNPFHSIAAITFELNESGVVSLQVFDLTGRMINSLVDQEMTAGAYTIQWEGFSQNGEKVSAGLYLCRIESGGVIETTGLCLLR